MDRNELKNNELFKKMVEKHFDPENSIWFEQFQTKHVICDITGEECDNGECCIGCPRAEKEVKSNLFNESIGLFPVENRTSNDVSFKSNWNNSFYEFGSMELFKKSLTHKEWVEKLVSYTELPDGVQELYHVWNECVDILSSMYKITGFLYLQNCPLIIICDDRVFAEAPYSDEA